MAQSDHNPQIRRGYSPLQDLIVQALRRFGDYAAGGAPGDLVLMMLEFANRVIDEVRAHPYGSALVDTPYYTDPTQHRPIPDNLMKSGLLYYYAIQQSSAKAQSYGQDFIRDMNRELWLALNGNTAIQMRVVDSGSNPSHSQGLTTDVVNGQVTATE